MNPLSANTKAILLLTAPLIVGRGTPSADLLTATEYKRVARFLLDRKRQPADLLSAGGDELLRECRQVVDYNKVKKLLERGFLLSQAIERWHARAIWVVSRADADYPKRLKHHLKEDAPTILYGCGDMSLLDSGGLAVVGSRDVDEELISYTEGIGRLTAKAGCSLISGGARGIDQAAMRGALSSGGKVIGVLAENLERNALSRENRQFLMSASLILVSAYDPSAGFNVGHAMQRNKLIYALSDAALVVSSAYEKGGTWTGAMEQLEKLNYVPVYIRSLGPSSKGLEGLRRKGALLWPNPSMPDDFTNIFRVQVLKEQQGNLLSRVNQPVTPTSSSPVSVAVSDHEKQNPAADNITCAGEDSLDKRKDSLSSPSSSVSKQQSQDVCVTVSLESMGDELFCRVKELLSRVPGSHTEVELASMLDVSKSQMKLWLQRAISEQWIKKHGKPAKYSVTGIQSVLFKAEPNDSIQN